MKLGPEQLSTIRKKWKERSGSVVEIEAVNVVQFLKPAERIHFVNECHRVLKKGGKVTLQTPHWTASKAYGDLSFEWPPVVEAWLYHLNKDWRKANNPKEKRYKCDFDVTFGFAMHPAIASRNQEYQHHALTFFKEAAQDLVATLIKR